MSRNSITDVMGPVWESGTFRVERAGWQIGQGLKATLDLVACRVACRRAETGWAGGPQGKRGFECQVKEPVDFVAGVFKLYSLEPWGSAEWSQAL